MSAPRPPQWAERLLARALARDPAAAAIVGDLREDFSRVVRDRGSRAARRWYAREAVLLAADRALRDLGAAVRGVPAARAAGRARTAGPRSTPISDLVRDAGRAARTLRRSPGFALFAAAVIGLGVGATTTVFSVLRPFVLAPLPFADPDRLVWIANDAPPDDQASLSSVTSRSGNLRDFRARARSFDGITGYDAFSGDVTLTGAGEPERLGAMEVAHDFLDVLGVEPEHGRGFTAEEGAWGGPGAALLSHGYWVRRFASDPGVVGRTLTLDGRTVQVVGVLPSSFDFASVFTPGKRVDVLVPYPISDETDAWGNTMSFVGRLRPGVGPHAAQDELDAIVAALQEEQPRRWGLGADLTPLREHVAGPFRPALLLLAAAAGTLLLIACVNVSNLLLARAPGRAREIAVHKALGASRSRLLRQLLLEALGMSLTGAALGCALAWGATRFVATGAAIGVPLMDGVSVDPGALLFAAGVSAFSGLLVGLVPALQVNEGAEAALMRAGGRGAGASRSARRMREALVVAEVMLACALLITGGLLVRSFRAVLGVELGFEPGHAFVWQVDAGRSFDTTAERAAYYDALAERVADVPGVEAAGVTDALPLRHNRSWADLHVVGSVRDEDADREFFPNVGSRGYRRAMGIELAAGRDFGPDDTQDTQPVVLINQTGARALLPGEDPLGRRLRLWDEREWEVVGVVSDVRQLGLEVEPGVQVYFLYPQMTDMTAPDLVVRSRRPAAEVVAAVSAAIREVDPALPTNEVWTMESLVGRAMSARRFTLAVLSAFGVASLLLAGLGIYGVLAHTVAERTPEIGIRMALGASATGVVGDVLRRTLALTGVGLALGAALSLAAARLVAALLYGVRPADPVTYAAGCLALLLVAAAASVLPAARAARTTGLRALRAD